MTLAQLATLLEGIPGFIGKVAYRAFPIGEAPDLPYVTFLERNSENFVADNSVFYPQTSVDIELYTECKDTVTESLVESALTDSELVWSKDEDYLDSEDCYMIVYNITI